ncbi:MAG: lipoyl synthase [Candidatus Omnitrophota bacterium]
MDKPAWIKKRFLVNADVLETEGVVEQLGLHTVCSSARCPNRNECFSRKTAAFMILGNICTRRCGFCGVAKGKPRPPDPDEPDRVARAAVQMGLKYVVITSVSRDDLPDQGANTFAETITAVRRLLPEARTEVLTPDFGGRKDLLSLVLNAKPLVFNHNLETVPSLYPKVRPQADYRRSLNLLAMAKESGADFTKSGLMLGLGEEKAEVLEVMADLRRAGCDILTLGQYLRPGRDNLPVQRYVPPEEFAEYRQTAEQLGFKAVAAGPFVRSSYFAAELFQHIYTI